jgi:hypothetical protein
MKRCKIQALLLAASLFAAAGFVQADETETIRYDGVASQEEERYDCIAAQEETDAAPYDNADSQETEMIRYNRVAFQEDQAEALEVGKYGMVPIYGFDVKDGVYPIAVESSSPMFRIVDAQLTVKDGEMTAVLTLSGQGYLKLYAGTAAEAAAADVSEYIDYTVDEEGWYTYEVPVKALDQPLALAAFSTRKEQWYDRDVLFDAGTLPEDALLVELPDYDLIEAAVTAYQESGEGSTDQKNDAAAGEALPQGEAETEAGEDILEHLNMDTEETSETEEISTLDKVEGKVPEEQTEDYESAENAETENLEAQTESTKPLTVDMEDGEYAIEVDLTGGSGKAYVSSPTVFIVRDGQAYVQLEWSSSYYDYMIVGSEKYLNTNEDEGNSVFEIPVTAFDQAVSVIADTTAMGTPHEIEYTLIFYSESIGPKSELPQEAAKRVVYIALVIIVGGGILNHFVQKRRRG